MSSPPPSVATERASPARGVSVCVFRGDEIVLVQRGKQPGYGRWAPIGGHVEAGESDIAAARRETLEETGLEVDLVGIVGEREIRDGEGRLAITLTVFAARWIGGEPVAGDDAMAARFVAAAEIEGYDLMAGVLPWIERARARIATDADGFEA